MMSAEKSNCAEADIENCWIKKNVRFNFSISSAGSTFFLLLMRTHYHAVSQENR